MDDTLALPPGVKLIGLLGGIASGKSFVARALEELGGGRLDADGAGHEVLRDPEVMAAARTRWGDDVFTPSGDLDRSALAQRVFGQSAASQADLAYLEQLTHPRIADRLRDQAEQLVFEGKTVLILDAPVLLKAKWDRLCTHLLYVDSSLQRRRERADARGWQPGELEVREALQEPLGQKRELADLHVDNSGSAAETKTQLARIWSELGD